MTVAELIAYLKVCPPQCKVMVRGYEGGYDVVNTLSTTLVAMDVNTAWYYGKHEIVRQDMDYEDYDQEVAVLLG
jgi:hypothetical protein